MQIKDFDRYLNFSAVLEGSVFRTESGDFYMKTSTVISKSQNTYNAVQLLNGTLVGIAPDAWVAVIKGYFCRQENN